MDSTFKELLEKKRSELVSKWFDEILSTYPQDPSGMLKNKKDRFENPVGYALSNGIKELYQALLEDESLEKCKTVLDNMIRVRAVQEFSPSKAVSFIFMLKKVIREELEKVIRQEQIYPEFLKFESKVDDLALLAFDIYSGCREQLNQIKTDELKRMTFTLLKKANLMHEIPIEEFEHKELKFNL
ncbi:hypothetical protein Desaci_2280 [Desulfosporosinus acidiphilus SJ4]|uniref:RsbT co-antagonist protein RsbRD N-terminal domain-containing protein n=1 Tax=Desulfosporosinus acidiphilus (strain DSM 22704 / JCM 16185 / SJ4) TaxID=646529 RepID=I4D611_DESAJ|nr:RsbRD N-terminal domain-containing protein [Desulfosporosinus acidiphilus]AFM41235.1 hypothetical protein Desaci_2280 [Desulfosporosinus acidiphilus SJ4]